MNQILLEQLQDANKIKCEKLIPFKENGKFYIRWEGSFVDANTAMPMKLIIPKLCMDGLNINKDRVGLFQYIVTVNFRAEESKDETLFQISLD